MQEVKEQSKECRSRTEIWAPRKSESPQILPVPRTSFTTCFRCSNTPHISHTRHPVSHTSGNPHLPHLTYLTPHISHIWHPTSHTPAPQSPDGRRPVCIQSRFILCSSLRAVMDTSWFLSPNSSIWAKRGIYKHGSAKESNAITPNPKPWFMTRRTVRPSWSACFTSQGTSREQHRWNFRITFSLQA